MTPACHVSDFLKSKSDASSPGGAKRFLEQISSIENQTIDICVGLPRMTDKCRSNLARRQEPRENLRRLFPLARRALDLLPARAREPVKLGPAIVVGDPPLGCDIPFLLELE